MKMSEYRVLHDKMEKAYDIIDKKHDVNLWIQHEKDILASKFCVYVKKTDSLRKPTVKEICTAADYLIVYKQMIKDLNAEFKSL
jgi:hypothetical protein